MALFRFRINICFLQIAVKRAIKCLRALLPLTTVHSGRWSRVFIEQSRWKFYFHIASRRTEPNLWGGNVVLDLFIYAKMQKLNCPAKQLDLLLSVVQCGIAVIRIV